MKLSKNAFLTYPIAFAIGVLSITSCKKKKDDPQPAPVVIKKTIPPATPQYYLDGAFGDTKISYKEGVDNFFSGFATSSDGEYNSIDDQYDYHFSEGGTWSKIIQNPFPASPTFSNSIGFQYNKFIPDIDSDKFPTQAELEAIYPVGKSTVFSTTSSGSNNADGWRIDIQDADGKIWASHLGAANQSSSFVTITSRGNEVINNTNVFVIKGSFACTVYDDSGNSKPFSGSFYQIFSDYSSY